MTPVAYSIADLLVADPAGTRPADTPDRESAEVRVLLTQAQAGDQGAFGRLIDLHQRVVYRTAYAALGRREDAEDAAQDAFVQAWRALPQFRGDAMFRTWLLTIVWRKALDRRRSRLLWWKRGVLTREDQDATDAVAGDEPNPERAAMARDTVRRVRGHISRLSPKLRDTLLLAASGEYSYEEIASMLGAPVGTIKWRVAEARRIVAEQLES